jgi:D-alanyl-lipoteichoic acid acyltransferase DltB (MBOAT superfamily)
MKQDHLFSQGYLRTDIVIFNIAALITFTICGLWHGMGWNFLIWGVMHGMALAVQRTWSYATRGMKKGRGQLFKETSRIAGIVLTFSFVSAAWVFFRMRTPEESFTVFSQITGNFYLQGFQAFVTAYYPVLMMMTAGYTLHFIPGRFHTKLHQFLVPLAWPWKTIISFAMIALILYFKTLGSAMPIYIQF